MSSITINSPLRLRKTTLRNKASLAFKSKLLLLQILSKLGALLCCVRPKLPLSSGGENFTRHGGIKLVSNATPKLTIPSFHFPVSAQELRRFQESRQNSPENFKTNQESCAKTNETHNARSGIRECQGGRSRRYLWHRGHVLRFPRSRSRLALTGERPLGP